jgi:hypothetical protein
VHDLRVADGPDARAVAKRLWDGVEEFAQFYGFASVLAVMGEEEGLISPVLRARARLDDLDEGRAARGCPRACSAGPMTCRAFPRDWRARAAALGPGPVIQTSGESGATEARARRICALAAEAGMTCAATA